MFGGLLLKEQGATYIEPPERKEFLDILNDKTFIPRFHTSPRHSISSLAEYTILQPNEGRERDFPYGNDLSFHGWLQRIRRDRYFPTFYFPSNAAGPDIVFCLRRQQDNGQRLLCAIQVRGPFHISHCPETIGLILCKVKTGTSKVSKEDSFKVIRTLDPNLWFQGYNNKRKLLITELHKKPKLPILTLLVVTSKSVEEFFTSAQNLRNGLKWMRNRVCRYCKTVDNPDSSGKQEILEKAKVAYNKAKKKAIDAIHKLWGELTPDLKKKKLRQRLKKNPIIRGSKLQRRRLYELA